MFPGNWNYVNGSAVCFLIPIFMHQIQAPISNYNSPINNENQILSFNAAVVNNGNGSAIDPV
jgi:hypothetical protein